MLLQPVEWFHYFASLFNPQYNMPDLGVGAMYALGLAPYCGYTLSILIGFVILFAQVMFCKWWLKSHKQGPLEFIWHKLTWGFKK